MNSDEHWRNLLKQAVAPLNEGVRHLDVGGWRPQGREQFRPERTAAVLVGVVDQDLPEVVLTTRAKHLKHHPGQISFPGGSAEEGDDTAIVTALREAEEEIGIRREKVRPIGFLDRLDTASNFRVLPVVGLVHQVGPYIPDGQEVEDVFHVPLQYVLDLSNFKPHYISRGGSKHRVHSLDWEGRKIWGVTAEILKNLAERSARLAIAG